MKLRLGKDTSVFVWKEIARDTTPDGMVLMLRTPVHYYLIHAVWCGDQYGYRNKCDTFMKAG